MCICRVSFSFCSFFLRRILLLYNGPPLRLSHKHKFVETQWIEAERIKPIHCAYWSKSFEHFVRSLSRDRIFKSFFSVAAAVYWKSIHASTSTRTNTVWINYILNAQPNRDCSNWCVNKNWFGNNSRDKFRLLFLFLRNQRYKTVWTTSA